jgi:hypothetical protein
LLFFIFCFSPHFFVLQVRAFDVRAAIGAELFARLCVQVAEGLRR